MLKKLFLLCCLFASINMQAQNAEERLGKLMNEARWFDLKQELTTTPTDSVNPLIYKMAVAITHHYFNRPDSACSVLGDLLNNHQEELGDNTLSMATLMGTNLMRANHYAEAADMMQGIYDQLKAHGTDMAQAEGYRMCALQYRAFVGNAPTCKPLHKADTYHVPMGVHNAMHMGKDKTAKGHFITMDGRINGKESTLVFDTGAGTNIISSNQARDYGLRLLDATVSMFGVGTQQGRYAIADTLRIGDMAWSNVPFLIIEIQTGRADADSVGALLPPVIGLPVMYRMQEIQLDFEHRQFIIPAAPSPCLPNGSNLLRTELEGLRLTTTNEHGTPLYFQLDTGGYNTNLFPKWYEQHKAEVQAMGKPDSLRVAGVGGVRITQSYCLPQKEFRLGNGTAVLDSVMVDTGIDLHTGEQKRLHHLEGNEDGIIGLDLLERFKKVVLNLKEMYLNGIPY